MTNHGKSVFLISLIRLFLLPISATVNQAPEEGLWTCSDWRTDRLVSARKHGGSSYTQWNPSTLPREPPHRILHALRHDQFQSKKGRGITLCALPCKILSQHLFVYVASSESNVIVFLQCSWARVLQGFWNSCRVYLWTFADFSLVVSPVLVADQL